MGLNNKSHKNDMDDTLGSAYGKIETEPYVSGSQGEAVTMEV